MSSVGISDLRGKEGTLSAATVNRSQRDRHVCEERCGVWSVDVPWQPAVLPLARQDPAGAINA